MIPHHRALLLFALLLLLSLLTVGCKDRPAADPPDADPPAATTAHAHDGADETCFICDSAKREPGRLWCKEHGRYEDRCWKCHPDLEEAGRPYCEEHGLYEDECFLCDPARVRAPEAGDGSGAAEPPSGDPTELFCDEHKVPEHQCGVCQPQLAAELAPGEFLLVRLASKRSAELAGLTVGMPRRSEGSASASLLGEIRYDGNRLARVTPLAAGVIAKVRVDVGQVVRKGELLAVVNAPAVAEAKARFISAQDTERLTSTALRRKEQLQRDQIGSQRALDEAAAEHDGAVVAASLARQGLLNLGFAEAEVTDLGDSATSALNLRAPFDGTVVERSAVLGSAVTGGEALFAIADLTQMWVELSVPEEVAPRVRVGMPVGVRVRALPSGPLEGAVSWVGPVVDERTRLVRARALVANPGGVLRQGMFADVTAVLEARPDAVRLPASAVHQVSDLPFVFVQEEDDLFAARRVEVGERLPSDEFVIRAGIGLDDAVVLAGGFALKSALLASRLGAGCADD
jgi:cobalt-zinc-cadmium efflux system membrane fusion protein